MNKDSELIESIRRNEKAAIENFYMLYRGEFIRWLKSQYRADYDTSAEIYQQAFIICYENILNGSLSVLTSSLKTYLFAVGRHKMNEMFRSKSRNLAVLSANIPVTEPEDDPYDVSDILRVKACLEQLGNPCRDLLTAFYYHHRNLHDIALEMDYRNADTAKNMKYKCLERLRKLFSGHHDTMIVNHTNEVKSNE